MRRSNAKQRTEESEGLGHGSVNCFGAGHTRLAVLARGPDWGEELKADDASPSLLAWRGKAPMARKIITSPVTSQSLRRRITTSIAYCSATVCVTASRLSLSSLVSYLPFLPSLPLSLLSTTLSPLLPPSPGTTTSLPRRRYLQQPSLLIPLLTALFLSLAFFPFPSFFSLSSFPLHSPFGFPAARPLPSKPNQTLPIPFRSLNPLT